MGGLWGLVLAWSLIRARPRGDPLPPLAAAAVAPFLLLHYPTHLALGTIPIILVIGHLLAAGGHDNEYRGDSFKKKAIPGSRMENRGSRMAANRQTSGDPK